MARIFGTGETRETIHGTVFADTIYGGRTASPSGTGIDLIYAGDGDDIVYGGDGGDTLYGEAGNDKLYDYQARNPWAGGSVDHLLGGAGDDTLFSVGPDQLDGGDGTNDLAVLDRFGYRGNLTIDLTNPAVSQTLADGTTLVDVERLQFQGGSGRAIVTGGALSDSLSTAGRGSVLNGADGNDGLSGYADVTLNGGRGDDWFVGFGRTRMNGGDGNDTFSSIYDFIGNFINGGSGTDILRVDGSASAAVVDVDISDPTVKYYSQDGGTVIGVERLEFLGGRRDDTAIGGALDDLLDGDYGADNLQGRGGNDTLHSGYNDGADRLDGGSGLDTALIDKSYWNKAVVIDLSDPQQMQTLFDGSTVVGIEGLELRAGSADDRITGGASNDKIYAATGRNHLSGGAGNDYLETAADALPDSIDGGNGQSDYASFGYVGTGRCTIDISDADLEEVLPDGTIVKNIERIMFSAGSGNDVITGGALDDSLFGGSGNDRMAGNRGNDTYGVNSVGDLVIEAEGQGYDHIVATRSWSLADSFVEELTLIAGAVTGIGNRFNNKITGSHGVANRLEGGTGDDTYIVQDRRDVVVENYNAGSDLVESSVSYSLSGQYIENLTLIGWEDKEAVGNRLANVIKGNEGDNIIDGGANADVLKGGQGSDTYIVDNILDEVIERNNSGSDLVMSSASYTLGSYVDKLTLVGTADINATGNSSSNTLTGNSGVNRLAGGKGGDTYVVQTVGDKVVEAGDSGVDLVKSSITFSLAGQAIENLTLTAGSPADAFGNGLNNRLIGGTGKNVLNGRGGADWMEGRGGDDTYIVDNSGDIVRESANSGVDLVKSSVSFSAGRQGIENVTLTGRASLNASGNALANTLTGNSGINRLAGLGGNDTYIVQNVGDVVVEAAYAGVDVVQTSVSFSLAGQYIENLGLIGTGNVNGTGNHLFNVIVGNTGRNIIAGGGYGDDLVAGIDDAEDRFVYTAAADSRTTPETADFIYQFDTKSTAGEAIWDKIDLRAFDLGRSDISFDDLGADVNVEIDLSGGDSPEMIIHVVGVGAMSMSDLIL